LSVDKNYPLFGLAATGAGIKPLSPMAKPLTKSQIISAVAETVGLTQKQSAATLEAIVNLAYKNAKNSFTLPGLGKSSSSIGKPASGATRPPASRSRSRPSAS